MSGRGCSLAARIIYHHLGHREVRRRRRSRRTVELRHGNERVVEVNISSGLTINLHQLRILMRVRKYEHITPILHSLHWLPIASWTEFKIFLLAHQCIHGNAPPYLKELVTLQPTTRSLRSSNTHLLKSKKTNLRTMGDRAFCSAAPELWNALPAHLRAPQSVVSFKKGLKTFLFKKAFQV